MSLFLIIEGQTVVGAIDIGPGESYTPPAGRQLVPVQPTSESLPMDVLELEQRTADPGAPVDGNLWYNNIAEELRARIDGVTRTLGLAGGWPLGNVRTVHPTDPDADFTTIAAALATATSGDVVLVAPASYGESVTVPAGVDLIGLFPGKNAAAPPVITFTHTVNGATVTLGANATLTNFRVVALCSTNGVTASAVEGSSCVIESCNLAARNQTAPSTANIRAIRKTGTGGTMGINHTYATVTVSGGGAVASAYALLDETTGILNLGDGNEFVDGILSGSAGLRINNAGEFIYVYGSNYVYGAAQLAAYGALLYRGGQIATSVSAITGLSDQSDNANLYVDDKTFYPTSAKTRMFKAALRALTSDPSDKADGDLWYNDTTKQVMGRANSVDHSMLRYEKMELGVSSNGVISTGAKGRKTVSYAGVIERWRLVSDLSTTCVLDVWKANGAIPTNANSITGTAKPGLSAAELASSTTLTGWTTAVAAGDVFILEVESNNNAKYLALELWIRATG